MPSKDYLMLRSAQRARLEARTASLQLIFWCVSQFPDSLLRREDEERDAALNHLNALEH
jgi:predicted component of type VI protein secretion system